MRADIYEYYKRQTAADGLQPYAAVRLFRRQAGRPDNGNHLESGEIRGNMRVGLSDEGQKTLELIFTFFKTLSFRSRKVVVSFLPPEKRKISADIKR